MASIDTSDSFSISTVPRLRVFAIGVAILTLAFAVPLYHWMGLALSVDLHSHVILIPVISGYLVWRKRRDLPQPTNPAWLLATALGLGALGLVCAAWRWGGGLEPQDDIGLMVGAYVAGIVALASACFGLNVMRAVTFPAFFLIFMVPMPSGVEAALEHFLQRRSAEAAHMLFSLFGETFLREGQVFLFPGLTIRVAQECSGIRSSLVLFILSLLAAHCLLRSSWRRALLVIAVLPLGILRNAFRVYVITTLTLHVNPNIIDSALHHRGGPIFFALSLVPFTALLWILWRTEQPVGMRKVGHISP